MTIIRLDHMRKAGICSRGLRRFALDHGFDFGDFLANGIDVEKVRHIDDVMVKEVIAIAEREAAEVKNG